MAKKSQQDNIKTIAISITDNNTIEYKFEENNLEYHYLRINSLKDFKIGLKKLNSILSNYSDIVLHCHMFHALMLGISYSLFYKKTPIVFTLHNILVEEVYRRFALFFTKAFRKADINFSSRGSKWYLKKITVIANGVDFEKFRIEKERTYNNHEIFKFLFLGRIEEQKNPLILPDLCKKLIAADFKNFVIIVAGSGNMKDQLDKRIKETNFDKYIKILGFQKNVKEQLVNSHCMILPSFWEGLPISLIEASATKLPIITTPVGSIPDFFNNTNSHVSDLDNFHEAMITVMSNYPEALAKAKKLYDENKGIFDIKSVYHQHLELYKSVL